MNVPTMIISVIHLLIAEILMVVTAANVNLDMKVVVWFAWISMNVRRIQTSVEMAKTVLIWSAPTSKLSFLTCEEFSENLVSSTVGALIPMKTGLPLF